MTISEERLDELFAAANPLTDQAAGALAIDDEFDDLLRAVSAPAPRRRRGLVTAVAAAGAIAVSGGVAAAGWHSSHTGIAVDEGPIGTSELMDISGDDFVQFAREAAAGIPFPPGDNADPYIRDAFPHSGLVSANGVRTWLSEDAQCAWEGYWLQARADGDTSAQAAATAVLQQIPSWPELVASDGGGVIDLARTVAAAAAAVRTDTVRQVWSVNCASLPRQWAHS